MPIKKLTVNIPMMLAIDTDKEVTAADVKNITESVAAMLRDGFFSVDNVYDASYEDDVKLEDFTFGEGETMEWVDKQQEESDSGENVPEETEEQKSANDVLWPYVNETEEENEKRRIESNKPLLTSSEARNRVCNAMACGSDYLYIDWAKDLDMIKKYLDMFSASDIKLVKDGNSWKVTFKH